MTEVLRIGCGAGLANDRFDAAVELTENGNLDVLVLECLAERTIALGQTRELAEPGTGYDPTLERRIRSLLGPLAAHGTQLVTNLGSANPIAAGELVARVATDMGVAVRIAVLTGDDVFARIDQSAPAWEDGKPLDTHGPLVSANAYLGVEQLLPAVQTGADIIITGRVADPSLFLAPLVHRFGWALDDWEHLARGTAVGHLLECGSHLTGGYFADPPYKQVPNLAYVGFPLAEVRADGQTVVTKNAGTGGLVTVGTVAEQMTYEVLDPSRYLTPDVTADFHDISLAQVGLDRVSVSAAVGTERPDQLKVSVGYRAGYRCEAEISYAGEGSVARARLASDVVRTRLAGIADRMRIDLFGMNALHGDVLSAAGDPYECRLRMSAVCETADQAHAAGEEVVGLYNNGPAGGGGARSHTTELIGVVSTDIRRTAVHTNVTMLETR